QKAPSVTVTWGWGSCGLMVDLGNSADKLLSTQNDFHLTPEHILMAVNIGLRLADRPHLEPFILHGAPDGSVFRMPALSGSWARCLEGLRHPHTQQIRPITFNHSVAKGRDDVVLVHLNHRLVQMCLRLLRSEVWARDDVKKLHRVTVRSVSDASLDREGANKRGNSSRLTQSFHFFMFEP
ncbi:hypothetical protein, partial [Aeromonas caviae]